MLKTTYKPSAPLPPGWTEHTAPSGRKYYYNALTKQSTYTRPQSVPEPEQDELQIDYNATAPDASLHATAQALDEFYQNSDPRKWPHSRSQHHDTQRADQQPQRSRRGHGGDRPKSKKAIPGAEPWILVTTKFGRRFVHNIETKQSLWKFPQDVMMAVIDLDRAEWERKQAQEREKGQTVAEEAQESGDGRDPARGREVVKLANATRTHEGGDDEGSSEYDEVEVTDDEDEDGENEAAKDNVALFHSLLDDFGISPYTTFDKIIEDLNLVEDQRYLALPNTRTRRDVFTEWAKERILAINAAKAAAASSEKAEEQNDPTISYLGFLHQHATPKLYWPEFKRKHRKEAVMKSYELSDKDRERLYRELTAKLKQGEAERRKELLALLKQHLDAAGGGSGEKASSRVIPRAIRRDVRYYILAATKRDEIVSGFFDLISS
ncbi:hypothetical protein DV735_g3499, partial [Chaetothyriales sp. CBS 134920]